MTNRTMLATHWDEAKGRIREAWGAVTDDDLMRLEGRWEQVVATIRRVTGETAEKVEAELDELIEELESTSSPTG